MKTEALYNQDIKIYVLKNRGVLYHRHVLIKRRACTLLQVWNSSPFIFSNVNQISAEEESFKIEILKQFLHTNIHTSCGSRRWPTFTPIAQLWKHVLLQERSFGNQKRNLKIWISKKIYLTLNRCSSCKNIGVLFDPVSNLLSVSLSVCSNWSHVGMGKLNRLYAPGQNIAFFMSPRGYNRPHQPLKNVFPVQSDVSSKNPFPKSFRDFLAKLPWLRVCLMSHHLKKFVPKNAGMYQNQHQGRSNRPTRY